MRSFALPSRRGVGAFAFVSSALVATVAAAQPAQPAPTAPRPARSSTQLTLRREGPAAPEAAAARARARKGDCAGALASFDAALRITNDPILRRDRGLCHEKLGHPYPAIDDYRAYLTERPDAPDAEQIRQRLAILEGQVGVGGASSSEAAPESDADGASASVSVSIGSEGVSTTSSSSGILGPKPGEPERDFDYYVAQEKLQDQANASPLRYGSGIVLGPALHLPRFFLGEGADGTDELAYGVALALRWSTGPTLSLVSELGYGGVGESGATSSKSGPLLMGGLEVRLPISRLAGDHLLLRGGVGYERYIVSGTRAVTNNLLGRFAFGYRHVFGPSIGLEILADGGPVVVFPESGDSRVNAVIGASTAFVVGF